MGAVTPEVQTSTSGSTNPPSSVWGGVISTSLRLDGTHHASRSGMQLDVFYFSGVGNADTWTSGIPNIVAVAWQPDDSTRLVNARLTDQATGTITFLRNTGTPNGWLWVLRGP